MREKVGRSIRDRVHLPGQLTQQIAHQFLVAFDERFALPTRRESRLHVAEVLQVNCLEFFLVGVPCKEFHLKRAPFEVSRAMRGELHSRAGQEQLEPAHRAALGLPAQPIQPDQGKGQQGVGSRGGFALTQAQKCPGS
jgi:hypothetical protein